MKKILVFFVIIALTVGFVFAESFDAKIIELAGKVEYQLPGSTWKAAKVGDIIKAGSMISTGFKSTAILQIGSATVTVKPVTRLSLDELVKSADGTQTQLFLMTGRVTAEVTPQTGQTTQFKVKSPTATASVRGTGIDFDGQNLLVTHGSAALVSNAGASRMVGAGEFSTSSIDGAVAAPVSASGNSIEAINANAVALVNQPATSYTQLIPSQSIVTVVLTFE